MCYVPHSLFPDVLTSPLIVCTFVPLVTVLCAPDDSSNVLTLAQDALKRSFCHTRAHATSQYVFQKVNGAGTRKSWRTHLLACLVGCLLACCSTVFPHYACLGGRFRYTVGTIELAEVVEGFAGFFVCCFSAVLRVLGASGPHRPHVLPFRVASLGLPGPPASAVDLPRSQEHVINYFVLGHFSPLTFLEGEEKRNATQAAPPNKESRKAVPPKGGEGTQHHGRGRGHREMFCLLL